MKYVTAVVEDKVNRSIRLFFHDPDGYMIDRALQLREHPDPSYIVLTQYSSPHYVSRKPTIIGLALILIPALSPFLLPNVCFSINLDLYIYKNPATFRLICYDEAGFLSLKIVLKSFETETPASSMASFNLYALLRTLTTLPTKSQSSAVSYLREKLKFSEKSALEVLNYAELQTLPPNSDSVIAFFEEQGCSRTRIRELIRCSPGLLCSDVKETLLPKMEFFRSKGASDRDVFSILFKSEAIVRSLEQRIIPGFNVIAYGVGSDSKAIAVIRKQPCLLGWDLDGRLLPKIKTLRDVGVLESNIISMFNDDLWPIIRPSCGFFNECVEEVKGMGFDPASEKFIHALSAYVGWGLDLKFYVFKHWGFSKVHVREVFRRDHRVLEQDGEKIGAVMAFLVKQMGFRPFTVLNRPGVFGKCMKEWIIPRGWFAKELLSRGLIEEGELSLSELFESSEKAFVQRFVNQHEDKAPELLKLYNEKKQLAADGRFGHSIYDHIVRLYDRDDENQFQRLLLCPDMYKISPFD